MSALRTGCDYCDTPSQPRTPVYRIKLSHTPNGDTAWAELCQACAEDIARWVQGVKRPGDSGQ